MVKLFAIAVKSGKDCGGSCLSFATESGDKLFNVGWNGGVKGGKRWAKRSPRGDPCHWLNSGLLDN